MDRKLQKGGVAEKYNLPDEYHHIATIEYTTSTELGIHVAQSKKSGRWFTVIQNYDKKTGEICGETRDGDGLLLSEYSLTRLTGALQDARQMIGELQTRKQTEAA